eukprot:523989_1
MSPEDIIVIFYICFQAFVIICVSISGTLYVRKEFLLQKEEKSKVNNNESGRNTENEPFKRQNNSTITPNTISNTSFCKLWFKIIWQMREVYMSFAVHIFDIFTDILVIIEWWNLEQNGKDVENIDTKIMAICAITVLLFHRFITTFAIWIKEMNIQRCFLQLLDLLIFEEIYASHKKIVAAQKNCSAKEKDAIDTTTSFKFIRNLEAVFESMPQSILQLVFIIRSSSLSEYGSITLLILSVLSIIQSIISMTNSILKNDNLYMNLPKWERHTQKLPPTIQFLKHAICRLSEVICRIGFLSLFWSVCGGMSFGVLLAIELLLIFGFSVWEKRETTIYSDNWAIEDTFLRIQALIVLPSELVYGYYGLRHGSWQFTKPKCNKDTLFHVICCSLICCYWPGLMISTFCGCHTVQKTVNSDLIIHYIHPGLKIGLALVEWIVLILWAVLVNDKYHYLFSVEHGLCIFIISILCYFIYTQYLSLFPNFSFPFGVSPRSRFGYAFNGELDELKRIKPNLSRQCTSEKDFWDLSAVTPMESQHYIAKDKSNAPCALFAMANSHYDIVQWLENEKKACRHIELFEQCSQFDKLDHNFARYCIDPNGYYYGHKSHNETISNFVPITTVQDDDEDSFMQIVHDVENIRTISTAL